MWRKTVIAAMSAVEREYRAASKGVALLAAESKVDPTLLHDAAVGQPDLRQCQANLEDTYLVRLFAVFEESLRDIWANAFGKATNPTTRDLLQGCGARQHVHHDDLAAAHLVRAYRNTIVHGGEAQRVSLPQARVYLCTFFGWMPKQW